MTVVLINPNSTEAMTASMLASARSAAGDLVLEGWTSHAGPPAIQGAEDGEVAAGPLLDLVRKADGGGAAAIIIGCFDDTALAEACDIARCPVIGIGQASYHLAAMAGRRFSVVTTLEVSVPILRQNISAYGLDGRLGRVRASGVPVLELERTPAQALGLIEAEAKRAIAEDEARCIVLGCGGMTRVARALRSGLAVPVVDGVEAAARVAAAIVNSGTSGGRSGTTGLEVGPA